MRCVDSSLNEYIFIWITEITYLPSAHPEKSSGLLGRGRRKKINSLKVVDQTDGTDETTCDSSVIDKQVFKVNQEGRYICQLCEKTFKTVSHWIMGVSLCEMPVSYISLHQNI